MDVFPALRSRFRVVFSDELHWNNSNGSKYKP